MARPTNTLLLEQAQALQRHEADGSSYSPSDGIAMARSMFEEGSKSSAMNLSDLWHHMATGRFLSVHGRMTANHW
jgi:hypothetical protein